MSLTDNYTKTHAGPKHGQAVAYNTSARRNVVPDYIEIMPHNVVEPLHGPRRGARLHWQLLQLTVIFGSRREHPAAKV